MTIAIGRAGRDAGLELTSPSYWSVSGSEVDCGGVLTASSLAQLVVLRDQVTGLADNRDEPVVPVNWTGDPSVDGFYEVLDASVPMPARGLAALKLDYRLKLRKLGVYPQIESRLLGALRTNAHSVVVGSTIPWWATPANAKMDWFSSGSTVPTLGSRTGDGGSVRLIYRTDGTLLMDATPTWTCAASDYYDMSAAIEVSDGTNWRKLVGRNLGSPVSPTTGWRLNNKFVRVMPGSDPARLSVQHHDGTQWETAKLYKLRWDISSSDDELGAFQTLTILRNSPEEVRVRIGMEQYAAEPEPTYLDLSLRRGSRYVSCCLSRKAGTYASIGYAVYRDTNEAATAHTGGVHATSADAGGNFYIIDTPNAKTNNLTRGGFYSAAGVSSFPFAIGLTIGGDAAPDDTSTSICKQYFAAVTETQRLSRR